MHDSHVLSAALRIFEAVSHFSHLHGMSVSEKRELKQQFV